MPANWYLKQQKAYLKYHVHNFLAEIISSNSLTPNPKTMKHIKLLFSTSLLFIAGNLSAQAIFPHQSSFMTMSDASSLTPNLSFLHFISEKVNLDSTKNDTAYYTVNFFESDSNYTDQYHLTCYNNQVYFSGKIIDYYPNKAFNVKNVLIYDFNLNVGDTMVISETNSKMNIQLKIDSLIDFKCNDGVTRKMQFFHIVSTNLKEYNMWEPRFNIMGLGGDHGIVPFRIRYRNSPFWQKLITACTKDNVNMYFSDFSNTDFAFPQCNEMGFAETIEKMRNASNENINTPRIKLYPNPVSTFLHLEGQELGTYTIVNALGETLMAGISTNQIDVSSLNSGIYTIFITGRNGSRPSKFIKE